MVLTLAKGMIAGALYRYLTKMSGRPSAMLLENLSGSKIINHTPKEVMEIMQGSGVAAGMVQSSKDLAETDPQTKEYNYFKEMEHPEIGRIAYENVPFKLMDTPGEARWPAPTLGQDNAYVFGEILGLSKEEIQKLEEDDVITPDLEAGLTIAGVEVSSEDLDDMVKMEKE
jgi:crotonobetainyl-CoA:carnitine CoA-transferase CaiB-like acyl-CoA transferase